MKLCRVPAKALSFHLKFLHIRFGTTSFPNLQQIQIETTPPRSPGLLLDRLDVLRRRNDLGVPLRLIDVKVGCEKLASMADHSAFLTAWKYLVGEDVRVEYFRASVPVRKMVMMELAMPNLAAATRTRRVGLQGNGQRRLARREERWGCDEPLDRTDQEDSPRSNVVCTQ